MQYLRIIVRKGLIKIKKLSFITYENCNKNKAKIKFFDRKIQSIISAARNTFAQNSVDILRICTMFKSEKSSPLKGEPKKPFGLPVNCN